MINKDSLYEFVHLVGLLIYILQYDAQCTQRQTDIVSYYIKTAKFARSEDTYQ